MHFPVQSIYEVYTHFLLERGEYIHVGLCAEKIIVYEVYFEVCDTSEMSDAPLVVNYYKHYTMIYTVHTTHSKKMRDYIIKAVRTDFSNDIMNQNWENLVSTLR